MTPLFLPDEEIFQTARRIDSAEARRDYLNRACGNDTTLRKQIDGLLSAYESSESFLETPSPEVPDRHKTLTEGPGTLIGPYKLLQKIGEGGMGVVFMAEQAEPIQRSIALKIIKPGMD